MRGFAPFKKEHTDVELHVSHWTGALPVLEVWPNWTYGGDLQGFFGRLTYDGSRSTEPDRRRRRSPIRFARNVYIDTLNSVYGRGWKRDSASTRTSETEASATRSSRSRRPQDAVIRAMSRAGRDSVTAHRITVMGPGATPVIRWEGARLGPYDRRRDAAINQIFDAVLAGDAKCALER